MLKQLSCKKYINGFAALLHNVVVSTISENIYCKRYLAHLLQHKIYYLHIYAYVLDKLQEYGNKKINETILIDFGAGNGMLGIFAKYCGFKKVYINDLDANFLKASEVLAMQLNIPANDYIAGDILAVQKYFTSEQPTAIVGTDVIEHIYNIDAFFATLQQINPAIVSVFTTASNPKNIIKLRQLKHLQWKDEHEGNTENENATDPTGHTSFLSMRKNIISNYFPYLNQKDITQLSITTRGLNEADIINAVKQFTTDKKMPVPADAFNTCNPYTGSWTERILSLEKYKQLYALYGFQLKVYNGFYNDKIRGTKKIINKILNIATGFLGNKISSFIVLVGFKNSKPFVLPVDEIIK